jgi:hypothetical protein
MGRIRAGQTSHFRDAPIFPLVAIAFLSDPEAFRFPFEAIAKPAHAQAVTLGHNLPSPRKMVR